jgi:uncharacterized protein YndB with AHSA1/START domain
VQAPIERAFTVFTERFGDFKPPEHNLLGAAIAETVFEPKVGGHIYDRAVDGSECHWARVLAYEPPDRVVFSWDISPQWQIETDPQLTSEVEVTFVAETPHRTRVELEHRHLDDTSTNPAADPRNDVLTQTRDDRSASATVGDQVATVARRWGGWLGTNCGSAGQGRRIGSVNRKARSTTEDTMDDYGYDGSGDYGYDGSGGDYDPGAASVITDGGDGSDLGYDGGFDPGAGSMISNGDITDVL